MTIDEASRRTGISKDMIRYYEKLGLIKPKRMENRYRDFSSDDLNTLVLIRTLSASQIPLSVIKQAFHDGSIELLLAEGESELSAIQKLQRQLCYREIEMQIILECFRQCAAGGAPQLCRYPERYVIWRSTCTDKDFECEHQSLLEEGDYFHYLASLELDVKETALSQRSYDRGMLLFISHPLAEKLPAQHSLRVILSHEPGRELCADDLQPYIHPIARITGQSRFCVLCNQIFHRMGSQETCYVCAEVLLGQPKPEILEELQRAFA